MYNAQLFAAEVARHLTASLAVVSQIAGADEKASARAAATPDGSQAVTPQPTRH